MSYTCPYCGGQRSCFERMPGFDALVTKGSPDDISSLRAVLLDVDSRINAALQLLGDPPAVLPFEKSVTAAVMHLSAALSALGNVREGRYCICADPENCTEAVPGYICRSGNVREG